jgi:hypothetical protein
MTATTDQAEQAPVFIRPAKPKAKPTKGIFSKVSLSTYTLLKEKFPGCSDGQAVVQAIEACLGVTANPDAFQGYKHFTCIHRAHGYPIPGLNRAQAARLISVVSKSDLAGLSIAEKLKLKKGIDRTTLQKKMKKATGAGEEFEFNGWLVLDDREVGQ